MRKFLPLLLLLIVSQSFAQFSPVNSGVTTFLLDIEYVNNEIVYISGMGGTVLKSTDKGETWTSLQTGVTTELYACYFHNRDTGYVAGTGDIFLKTTDGGITWNRVILNFTGYNFRDVRFKNAQEGYLVGWNPSNDGGVMFKTVDGGTTWSHTTYTRPIQSINFHGNLGIAAGSSGLAMRSTDGGTTWSTINLPSTQVLTGTAVINKRLIFIVGTNGEIFRSTDGGENFNLIPSNTKDALNSVFFFDEFTGFIAGGNITNNTSIILKTTDGGNTWFTVPSSSSRLYDIFFIEENNGLAVGNNGSILKYNGNHNIISGRVYDDANSNCISDPGEAGIKGIIVKAEPGPYFAVSDSSGNYKIPVGGAGAYLVNQELSNKRFISDNCTSQGQTVDFSGENEKAVNINFGNQVDECSFLTVAVSSNRRRRCFTSSTRVIYCNEGTIAADNVQIKVIYPKHVVPLSSSRIWDSQEDSILTYTIGHLESGECGSIIIQDSVLCGNEAIRGLTACTKASISPVGTCNKEFIQPSPDWDKSSIKVAGECVDGVVKMYIKNGGDGNMTGSHEYRVFINDTLISKEYFMLASGQTHVVEILADGKTVRLEADQHVKHPGYSRPRETVEACEGSTTVEVSKGFVATVPMDDMDEFIDIHCLEIIDSYDPNDKQVLPSGMSENNYIYNTDVLEYLVRFQNTGTDTAYTVIIKDTLHAALDAASIQVVGSSHPYTWNLSGSVNPVLTFSFHNINLPDSSTNEPGSNGFVNFKIKQKGNNPTGTIITNSAGIYFDYNSPIFTNETSNEVWDFYPQDLTQESRILNTTVITGNTHVQDLGIMVHPNPFKDAFSVNFQEKGTYDIALYDMKGIMVMTKRIDAGAGSSFQLPAFQISKGIYQLKIFSANGASGTWKVVKF